MLRRAAERPAGRLTEVFHSAAERQAAYKFVEGAVAPAAVVDAIACATFRSAPDWVYAVIDGTSLSLTDRGKSKDFGSIGPREFPTRGIKVLDSIAVDPDGTPRGLLDLHAWVRGPQTTASKRARRRRGDTETKHWVEVIDRVAGRARKAGVEPWFVLDREGDATVILRALVGSGGFFTVRVAQQERRCFEGNSAGSLMQQIAGEPVLGRHFVDVPKSPSRRARVATMDVRIGRVTLDLHEHGARRGPMDIDVVWAREKQPPRGEMPLDWMLFTNRPVSSFEDAITIIESYCHRWRIEDFHRTWKRGCCHVEETQLRKRDHVVRWAAMLAAVAARVERLKHLARTRPDEPATIELRPIEIEALKEAKRTEFMKRTETVGDEMPSIATAVRWIAEFGGFAGNASVTPGSVTIGRGLERLLVYARGFEQGAKLARKRG
jgi:hypothetical protein